VGDRVLETAAALLRDAFRNEDVIGRYGGEELIVIMPETNADAARIPAERFLAKRAAAKIPLPDGTRISVTASGGIAGLPEHAISEHDLIALADAALYKAKEAGKNRIVLSPNKLKRAPDPAAAVKRRRRRADDITQGSL